MSELRFKFGKNWERFIKSHFNEERVNIAKEKLLNSLRLADMKNFTFLDIGCGSGLHSLVAILTGAKKVFSFNYDINSVRTTEYIKNRYGISDERWTMKQGSVLDNSFMQGLDKFDIVYSWGVLHHTGDTWNAISNASIPLAENGILFIALYSYANYENRTLYGHPSPEDWLQIKRRYVQASWFTKRFMELTYVKKYYIGPVGRNPINWLRKYRQFKRFTHEYILQTRGMEFWTDIRDWFGGYPMDFVKESEVIQYLVKNHGLLNLDMNVGEGNTEFIFKHSNGKNWWDEEVKKRQKFKLEPPFKHHEKNAWIAKIPNGLRAEQIKKHFVLENESWLSFPKSAIETIVEFGSGRSILHESELYFSSSDNTDPNTNKREYHLLCEIQS